MTNSLPDIPPGDPNTAHQSRHPPRNPTLKAGPNPSALEPQTLTDAAGVGNPPGRLHFRRPLPPFPIERYDLPHPAVPEALDGLTILHITDLHVRKGRPLPAPTRRAIEALRTTPADLIIFTGDYMNHPGDEPSTMVALRALVDACRARLGVFGIFGNHDTWDLRSQARSIPGITWLTDQRGIAHPLPDLRLVGTDEPEDLLATLVDDRLSSPTSPAPFTLGLIHYPTEILVGADFNIPILFGGHTHGGQFRLSPRLAPHTSCDLPADRPGGILRVRTTLCAVSRGLGNAVVEVRFNCPPHIPFYTLRRATLPALGPERHEQLTMHRAW